MLISATTSAPLPRATSMVARSAMPNGEPPEPTFNDETPEPLPTSMLRSIPAFSYQPCALEWRMVRGRRPVQNEIDGLGGPGRQRRRQQCERQFRDPKSFDPKSFHGTLLVCGPARPDFPTALSLPVVASTNATRDGPNCQLSGIVNCLVGNA